MATFYTADTHFCHSNAIKFGKRPYQSVDEMNAGLIANWNGRISPRDDIWVLGDFAYRNTAGQIAHIFAKLNGHKRLIIGNHDNREVLVLPWVEAPVLMADVIDNGEKVVLCHYPMRDWNNMYRGSYHLYGHCHGGIEDYSKCADVGVDRWNWLPVTFPEVQARIRAMGRNPEHRQD